jgi:hypothetical protein
VLEIIKYSNAYIRNLNAKEVGLGLAVFKKVATRYKGDLTIVEHLNEETIF